MRHLTAGAISLAVLLGGAVNEVRAQYPPGYGGYGWGGWGGGGRAITAGGDIARGMGVFAQGVGQYNVNTAQAASINTDTVMRWNQAVWAAQHAINVSHYYNRERRKYENNKALAGIDSRLKDSPEERDVEDGDALNVQIDILLNPKVYAVSIMNLKTPVSRDMIREIPFQYDSEGFTICLHQLSAEDGWPLALRDDAFGPYRSAMHRTMETAIEEDAKGELSLSTIKKAEDALTQLRRKFEMVVPKDSPDFFPAYDHLKGLAGMTRMLHSPKMDEILAGLESAPNTTLGDLLGFMHSYSLRFAPATTSRQKMIYQQLYPVLASATRGLPASISADVKQAADSTVTGLAQATGSTEKALGDAANGFFTGMNFNQLQQK